jgi:alanine dehydrogenase
MITNEFGKGLLFGNKEFTDVIWALEQSEFAAKTAIGLGASVKFFDNSLLNCAAYKTT